VDINELGKMLKNKKKLEFFQRIVLIAFFFSMAIILSIVGLNFSLLWTGRMPMTQETVAAITTYGGLTTTITASAYAALQAVRAWSINKHCRGGVKID